MNELGMFISAAIALEVTIELLKFVFEPLLARLPLPDEIQEVGIFVYLSAALGVAFAFVAQLDLFAALGLIDLPIFGTIATGLIIGRGSNFVNDILERVRGNLPQEPS